MPRKSAKAVRKKYSVITCARCEKKFPTRKALAMHSKAHLSAVREMEMLMSGQLPEETKLGLEFKGKNRIIVS